MEVIAMDLFTGFLFKGLDQDQLGNIAAITREISMENGQKLFVEGEEAEHLYILKEGAVELMTGVEQELQLPISMLRDPGDIFGTHALIAPHQYSLSARCEEAGTLLSIERSSVKKLMVADRGLECMIMRNLAEHFLDTLRETRQELKTHFRILLKSMRS
jgi:CRP/FNR family cyclic AMP-dependent transcriptional regulator